MPSAAIRLPERDVPVAGAWDVLVAGGGPAGCAAAVASARAGARTLLLEKAGHLGGATVNQLVVVVLSTNGVDFQGVWHEYHRRLLARGEATPLRHTPHQISGSVDPEGVKHVWDELLDEAGAETLHHAHASGVLLENGAVRGVVAETRAGTWAFRAARTVDATGDGIVCHHAGASWSHGDGANPWAMALTKVFRLGGVRRVDPWPDPKAMARLEAELDAALARGDYATPVMREKRRLLNYIRGRAWELPAARAERMSVVSRVLRTDPLDPWALSRAEREGRRQAREAADFYRRFVPGCEQAYLNDTAPEIGVRSSRRIHGLATATEADARNFALHPDDVARASWDIDVWPADSYSAPAVDRASPAALARKERLAAGAYFGIRYGCLLPAGVDNLLVAGRCLSAEHVAESSLRIQQTCMATGEAAGLAAAMSAADALPPRELPAERLLARLAEHRSHFEGEDPSDHKETRP